MRLRPWTRRLAVVVTAGSLLIGCGSGQDDATEVQPTPGGSTVTEGIFDELPRLPRSEPFGSPTVDDDIVTRTYKVTGVTAEAVIAFYDTELPPAGWVRTDPVHREDTAGRADWVRDDHRLEVSAIAVDGDQGDSSEQAVVQYSLLLRPVEPEG